MSNTVEEYYLSSDLALSAYLMVKHQLIRVEGNGSIKTFVFPATDSVKADVQSYFTGAAVPARTFAMNMRDLKALCRQG